MNKSSGSVPASARQNDTKTPIWQVKQHELWVKTVLISDIIEPGDKVCELHCGKGNEIGKWARGKIGKFVGVDILQYLKEAKERWIQKKEPFPADFVELNLHKDLLEDVLPSDVMFDSVCCFNGLQFSFDDRETALTFMKNVASRLKTGGYFFGLLPDASELWHKAVSITGLKPILKGDLYSIEFNDAAFHPFGTKYTMRLEGDPEVQEYLVHFPSLRALAEQVGLIMLEITNLTEFFEEHRKNYVDSLKSFLGKDVKLDPKQKDVIQLFCAFVFQKEESKG